MFQKLFWLVAVFATLVQGSPVSDKPGTRIIGGENAVIEQYPFMVSLRSLWNFHFCGGSILNSRWVLTAAHCTYRRLDNSILVVAGTSFRTYGGSTHRSSRIISHPDFNYNTVLNDIALVQVATAFVFNERVSPINLPTARLEAGFGVVAGWGYTGPMRNNQLQKLDVEILSHDDCASKIALLTDWFEPNKVCTLTIPGQGSCFGDSGGPLIVGAATGADVTVDGITSFGFRPCASIRPDVFERVFSHLDWILGII